MAAHALDELLRRLDGWKVCSQLPLPGVVQLHLTGPTAARPDVLTRAMVLVEGEGPTSGVIGVPLRTHEERVSFGDWTLSRERVVAGQLLDTAIIETTGLIVDPLTEPTATSDHILTSGELVWPDVADRPHAYADLDFLAGVTRTAMSASPVLMTVETTAKDRTDVHHLFVTPWAAMELHLEDTTDHRIITSYFPVEDAPPRLLERCGVARALTDAGPSGTVRHVTVRVTHFDGDGLTLGALAWEQAADGSMMTSTGPVSPQAIASELLAMLPGVATDPVEESVDGEEQLTR